MDFCVESKKESMVRIKKAVQMSPKVHVSELLGLIPDVYIDELAASLQVADISHNVFQKLGFTEKDLNSLKPVRADTVYHTELDKREQP